MIVREAGGGEADIAAAIHIASFRSAYRGFLADAYLDGPIVAERLAFWRRRFAESDPSRIVLLAEEDGIARGFICAFLERDPQFGTFIDNFHVLPERKGQGVGRMLLQALAQRVAKHRPGGAMFLWVYQENRAARRAYEGLGGKSADLGDRHGPEGSIVPGIRYVWPLAAVLRAAP